MEYKAESWSEFGREQSTGIEDGYRNVILLSRNIKDPNNCNGPNIVVAQ